MSLAEKLGLWWRSAHRELRQRAAAGSSRPFQQLRVLRVIAKQEVVTQNALAERLNIDAPAASRLVDRLERDGLVTRCRGRDRRCVQLATTAKARHEVAVIDEAVQWLEAEMRAALTPSEARALERALDKLNESFAKGSVTKAS